MKAIIIIAVCLFLAFVLKAVESLTGGYRIKSVGAKSSKKSGNIPTVNVNDPESVAEGVKHYKDLID